MPCVGENEARPVIRHSLARAGTGLLSAGIGGTSAMEERDHNIEAFSRT